jgi:hypothetical protein
MGTIGVYVYTVAVGFVAAGLMSSLYQLATNKTVAFEILFQRKARGVLGVLTLTVAGPAVIMRNAIRGRLIENRPGHWLALSTLISAAWSFLQGVFILSFIVAYAHNGII